MHRSPAAVEHHSQDNCPVSVVEWLSGCLVEWLFGCVAAGDSPAKAVPVSLLADIQRTLALLLAPFAPYLAHELWEMLGEKGSLLRAPWPEYDPALAKEEEIELPVQVNGKLRSRIVVPADAADDLVRERALADEKIVTLIDGKQIVKVIVVTGKLVNIVVR